MENRNPSPPPEVETDPDLYRADNVGNTVISKKWVLATLMEIINEVDRHASSAEDDLVDVSDDLQDSACKLWDICVDQDVAVFLLDFDIVDILYGVIVKSKSPRITEISVGILGNMACSEKACGAITDKEPLRSVLLALLATPDTQTLIELVRLFRVCLNSKKFNDVWIKSFEEDQAEVMENAQFIFNSSTNSGLLRSLSEVFDQIFEASEAFAIDCCTKEFVGALLEGIAQINKDSSADTLHLLSHSLHALHNIAELDSGKAILASMKRATFSLLSSLCLYWMTSHPKVDYSSSTEMSSSEVSVSCCLSVATVVLRSQAANGSSSTEPNVTNDVEQIVLEIDDEERELILKFARCILSAKGVLSAITVVSSLSTSNEEDSQLFKTPLHPFKGSPRTATPQCAKTAGDTPKTDIVTVATPDGTPEVAKAGEDDATPPSGSPRTSPVKKPRVVVVGDGSWREETPAVVLCSLAKELLQTAESTSSDAARNHENGDCSPILPEK